MSKEHTKYTPTPWAVDTTWNLITADCGTVEVAACHAGERMHYKRNKGETAIANAAHIVLCVNTHQKLLNALKMCISAIDGERKLQDAHGEFTTMGLVAAQAQARTAIVEAGGEL